MVVFYGVNEPKGGFEFSSSLRYMAANPPSVPLVFVKPFFLIQVKGNILFPDIVFQMFLFYAAGGHSRSTNTR